MNLLLTGAFQYTNSQIKQLEDLGYKVIFVQDERIPLDKQSIATNLSEIDVVVCNGLFLYNDIKQFKSLKYVQLTSAGFDRVPLNYIIDKEIRITNARGIYSPPIAEWVVLKILEIYKKTRQFYKDQSKHKWVKQRDLLELTGKTATIVGFGSVGFEVAKRLRAFEVIVNVVDCRELKSEECKLIDDFYILAKIDLALAKSDIIILTLPLTDQSFHLINSNRFAVMKDNSILINVSRGGVIDEMALIETLQYGRFLGIALDVFENEPLQEDSPLWDFDRVIITPHNSFVSELVNKRLFELILMNLKKYKI
jgi:phosphoglycerate dehydrogenase-like enzyme